MVNSTLRNFVKQCGEATEGELKEISDAIGEGAASRAPKGATGDLASSMHTEVDTLNGNTQARIIFGSKSGMEYVVVQHEHTDFQHPNGGEAKFLEKQINEDQNGIMVKLANRLRSSVNGGG
jgi:hypothetical protein